MTQAEHAVLQRVAQALRIPPQLFLAMLQARGATTGSGWRTYGGENGGGQYGASGGRRRAAPSPASLDQAYAQLGLTRQATDADVKRAYRKLVSQYHPDKLVARGLPEEMMEVAKTRVREINTAYDRIKAARGFK
ncbi:MAG: DnaJ domain-containing protein [Xanthomonadales bacterium]|nr:DnaJ domain-containing protein [Xanthomonadales bacterium]